MGIKGLSFSWLPVVLPFTMRSWCLAYVHIDSLGFWIKFYILLSNFYVSWWDPHPIWGKRHVSDHQSTREFDVCHLITPGLWVKHWKKHIYWWWNSLHSGGQNLSECWWVLITLHTYLGPWASPFEFLQGFPAYIVVIYHLVMTNIAMENHYF